MNTEEALTAFATVILVVAIFAVIVFVLAKITQFQRSRQARTAFAAPPQDTEDRTQWSDDAFGVPSPPPLTGEQLTPPANPDEAVMVNYADPFNAVEPEPEPPPPLPPPPLPVPPPPPPPLPPESQLDPGTQQPPAAPPPAPDPEPEPPEPRESTGDHWVLGSSPFLPTPRGSNPSPASIERRYWQNLAAGNSAEWLGPDNLARLAEGKPPARVNRRTGRTEQLQAPPLNEPGDEHDAPRWPAQAVDPFARADR